MRKEYIIAIVVAITIIVGIIIGLIIGGNNRTSNLQPEIDIKLAQDNESIENEIQAIETSNTEIKTTPNTLFIFNTYYKECKHTTVKREKIAENDINKTEEDLQEKYRDWAIKEFTADNVVLYQEKDGICDEHYLVKDNNGYVSIYIIDIEGNITLKETTEIITAYLPEADQILLKDGIRAIGQEELNATLEDYE